MQEIFWRINKSTTFCTIWMDCKEVLQVIFGESRDQQHFDTHAVEKFDLASNILANQQINNILHHIDELQGGLASDFWQINISTAF